MLFANTFKRGIIFLCSIFLSFAGFAQSSAWQEVEFWNDANQEPRIHSRQAAYYELDFQVVFESLLSVESIEIGLPLPGKGLQIFTATSNDLMPEEMANQFPEIRAFNIVSVASRNVWGKLEISPKGLRAMIFIPGESTVFIDPVYAESPFQYIAYRKSDFYTSKLAECYVGGKPIGEESGAKAGTPYNDCELQTYRLALAATAEYTAFHGGPIIDAIDAQVTTMNRVNGVYERDFAVTMVFIPNNAILIYTNPETDPYTNGDAGAMLQENQANVNSLIGAANYDIGHVFGTNSGGVAGLGVVCSNNSKARGVTGSASPVNDPFDIDYVAHEMGHQFGGNHSFNNSCGGNRNNGTAVEPGSGSTIMAYAGICVSNVQNNSDDHFHGVNLREIGIQLNAHNCPVTTAIDNVAPQILDVELPVYIPASTPFALTAIASDDDDDVLTYCWEQMDNEISDQPPVAEATGGPNFRSNSPTTNPTRYFPSLVALAANGPFTWERLPSVSRIMDFRVTVRDNAPGAGCTQYEDVDVNVVGTAGPFVLNYPSASGIVWQGFSYQNITWDVANTTAPPINAELVDIFLSTDGGQTYATQIADNVPNNGTYLMQAPNIATSTARVMVINSEGTFFDISNNNFTITLIENGFALETSTVDSTICQGQEVEITVSLLEIGAFNEVVKITVDGVPNSSTVDIGPGSLFPGSEFNVGISTTLNSPPGIYNVIISATAASFTNSFSYSLILLDSELAAPSLAQPENFEINLSTSVSLTWQPNTTPAVTYAVQVSDNLDFSNLVLEAIGIDATSVALSDLESSTTYYWRVRSINACGSSAYSAPFSFTTFQCVTGAGFSLPINIPSTGVATVQAPANITTEGTVADVNVSGIAGTHPNISELSFSLISPLGTQVLLTAGNCGLNITMNPNTALVNSPQSIAGNYISSAAAAFGPDLPSGGISGAVALASDGSATPNELCDAAVNGTEIFGKIALVYRGNCPFVQKVLNAQTAGAIAVIVINNQPGVIDMGGNSTDIEIPSVMVSNADGATLISGLGGDASDFNFSFDDDAANNAIPCPTTDGGTYIPSQALLAFNGEEALGTWTLQINDLVSGNGGQLNGWNLEICVDNVVSDGIREKPATDFTIFPNPGTGSFTIETSNVSYESIQVFDAYGRAVFKQKNGFVPRQTIDLSAVAEGVYFIRLGGDAASAVQRVVKIK